MRIMKKSLAMLLALTMVLSLVAINVVAGDENTVKVEQNLDAVLRSTTVDQDVEVEIYIETDATGINGFKATLACPGLTFKSFTAPEEGRVAFMNPMMNKNTGIMVLASATNRVLDEGTLLATAVFTVPANTAVGEYPITITLDNANIIKEGNVPVAFTADDSVIRVIEKQYINDVEEYTVEDAIAYGATAPELPATVKGLGKTSSEVAITAEDDIALEVDWEDINTLQAPGAKTVNGTVAEPVSETIEFKNDDYTEDVDSLTAVANYTIAKSTAGVVAPVEIDVEARFGGEAAGVADIVELAEVVAVETTTIKLEDADAEEETVELDWDAAEPADMGDATLNLGTAEDSIVLNVPVIPVGDETTYYNLDEKTAEVTITVKSAVKMYNAIEAIAVDAAVEYGATEGPDLPATVKGSGKTVGGQEFDAEYSDAFDVAWDEIDTLVAPDEYTVNGTVAEPVDALINFKNNDYTEDVDSLTATATYEILKSTAGVVAPVADIEVAARNAGDAAAGVATIVALEEVLAVETTTIKLATEGAAEETVELDWAAAEPADEGKTTLNLGSDEDSIVLKVPVIPVGDDTTYYNLEGKFVEVTIQMVKPWIPGDADGNDSVGVNDVVIVLRYLAGYDDAIEGINLDAADVDGVAGVGVNDAVTILRHLAAFDDALVLPLTPQQ